MDVVTLERLERRGHRRQRRNHAIGHHHHTMMASLGQVCTKLARHAGAVAHRRGGYLEGNVAVFAHGRKCSGLSQALATFVARVAGHRKRRSEDRRN